MPVDFTPYLGPTTRSVTRSKRDGEEVWHVTISRAFPTTTEDLWDALTNAERLPRWFLPVSGELRLGGRYQFEGNAGGTITDCDRPRFLAATWEFGPAVSWVEVTLAQEGEEARLTLNHIMSPSPHWDQFGPGATGVGWDLGMVGLAAHIASGGEKPQFDEAELLLSPGGKEAVTNFAEDWGRAGIEGGIPADEARAQADATAKFYRGELMPGG